MESKRDNSLDAACGLMIIYMIYGHICLWSGVTQVEIFPRLLFFFMPWFFFKSGMFFKPRSYKSELSGGGKEIVGAIHGIFHHRTDGLLCQVADRWQYFLERLYLGATSIPTARRSCSRKLSIMVFANALLGESDL